MDDLLAARGQMAMSLAFHILFACAGMAMPLLMVLAGKTSEDLLSREGKEHLAEELRKAASRGMGIEMEDEDEHGDPKKKKKKKVEVESPIVAVHFSNFIVQ